MAAPPRSTAGRLQLNREISNANLIRAWEPGRLRIGESWFEGPLLVSAETIVTDWDAGDPAKLTLESLSQALAMDPEIIVLGTGASHTLPDLSLMAALAERAIGLEIMSTPAACRTFNVLVHEQRRVVAALFG